MSQRAESSEKSPSNVDGKTPRRRWRLPIYLSVLLLIAMVGIAVWRSMPQQHAYYTDGADLRVSADTAQLRDVLWREPVALSNAINASGDDYEPALSNHEQTLYFVRGKTGDDANIYTARRIGDAWSEPVALDAVNSGYDDLGPRVSADGLSLYFYSDRPGGIGGYDLWVARRATRDGDFGEPMNLGARVNTAWDEYSPAPAPDASAIYFSSNRPVNADEPAPSTRWSATLREDRSRRGYDLYAASVSASGFGEARRLDALCTPADEGTPAVSPAGDFLYFSSNRSGGAGAFDLYRVRFKEKGFGAIEWLGNSVNTPADELDPSLSMEGFELHFSSNRAGVASRAGTGEPEYDIYRTTSREVFRDAETLRAGFDWDGMWAVLLPSMLLLLLLLLLLLMMRAFLDSTWRGRLSLLMRCLLASLLAHLLLLALFMFWQVTTSFSGLFNRPGGVRVAVAAPARAAGLAAQVRGSFADAVAPTIVPVSLPRVEMPAIEPVQLAATQVKLARAEFTPPEISSPQHALADAQPVDAAMPSLPDVRTRDLPVEDLQIDTALPKPMERMHAEESPASVPIDTTPVATQPRPALPQTDTSPTMPQMELQVAPVALTDALTAETENIPMPVRDAEHISDRASAISPQVAVQLPAMTAPQLALPTSTAKPQAIQKESTPKLPTIIPHEASRPMAATPPMDAPRLINEPAQLAPATIATDNATIPQAHIADATPQAVTSEPPSRVTLEPQLAWADTAIDLPAPALQQAPPQRVEEAIGMPLAPIAVPARADAPLDLPTLDAARWELPAAPTTLPSAPEIPIDLPNQERVADAAPTNTQAPPRTAIDLPPLDAGPLELPIPSAPSKLNAVSGTVVDAHTGEPLPGSAVRLDLAGGATVTSLTDDAGAYALEIPDVPEYFAISASLEGYLPASTNISADAVRGRALIVHFQLRRADLSAVAIEAVPDVHHLGDDHFTGSVNSQFQKQSEGARYTAEFELSRLQVAPYMSRGVLVMLTRGVQMRHPIYLNGRRTSLRLASSPNDGSFGEFRAEVDIADLREGTNTFEIRAQSRGDDIDDFEFVNVQLHVAP
ncbi:MAG: PD40 domain-containing protein [Phycisphaerales bacterium]|nr:PD40 domain-containing protein [Phycisphaerales bacterium]